MQEPNPPQTIQQTPLEMRQAALAELTPDQFNLWRHHPVSRVFLQWMRDWADEAEKRSTADWLAGRGVSEEARGRILAWREASGAHVEQVRQFYGVEAKT